MAVEPFAPPEITWPSVLVLQDCSLVIPMARDVLRLIASKTTTVPPISTAIDFPILVWMSVKREFVETKLYAQLRTIVTDALAHQDFNLTLHPK